MHVEDAHRGAVCLAGSPGGHLALLLAVRGAFDGVARVWVTGASSQAEALRTEGEDVRLLPAWARDVRGLQGARGNLSGALAIARSVRPRLVVAAGAGHIVPFALFARALGARLTFVETMARVDQPSLSGRILAPFAATVAVQWEELAGAYRDAVVCRPALLEADAARAAQPRDRCGTFVSVGTRPEPFDRLLAAVERAVTAGLLPEPVIAQSGSSTRVPAGFAAQPWMAPGEIDRAIDASRFVVCHAGSAIVAAAVRAGHRPLVMPRLVERGEHRTRHQGQVLAKLAEGGLVVPVADGIGAGDAAAAAEPPAPAEIDTLPSLETVLRRELEIG